MKYLSKLLLLFLLSVTVFSCAENQVQTPTSVPTDLNSTRNNSTSKSTILQRIDHTNKYLDRVAENGVLDVYGRYGYLNYTQAVILHNPKRAATLLAVPTYKEEDFSHLLVTSLELENRNFQFIDAELAASGKIAEDINDFDYELIYNEFKSNSASLLDINIPSANECWDKSVIGIIPRLIFKCELRGKKELDSK